MAQTGYTPISIYYSATATNVPTAGNLVAGELAINTADGKLFYKDSAGVVQVIGTKGGVGSSTTTQVLYNSSGLVVGSANMTFSGTALTLANDASISGLTVGKGGGAVATGTALGYQALNSNSSGTVNTAIGYQAGYTNTTNALTAVGYRAGYLYNASLEATGSVFVGYSAGSATTTGHDNTFVGGSVATANTSGSYNTALGNQALQANTTADQNTAVGYQAGQLMSTGGKNTALGYVSGNTVTTGTYNTLLGYNAQASAATNNYELVISASTGITGKGSSTGYIYPNGGGVYQGNNSATWSITSDVRLKKNIVDNTQGLDKILPIQVRNFEYRLPEEITEVDSKQAIQKTGIQLGAIAQELQTVLPECVKQESTGIYTVDADPLIWYLVNAVKELKAEIDQLKGN